MNSRTQGAMNGEGKTFNFFGHLCGTFGSKPEGLELLLAILNSSRAACFLIWHIRSSNVYESRIIVFNKWNPKNNFFRRKKEEGKRREEVA